MVYGGLVCCVFDRWSEFEFFGDVGVWGVGLGDVGRGLGFRGLLGVWGLGIIMFFIIFGDFSMIEFFVFVGKKWYK